MDWKKETLDPAELERRQREYARAAMSMMKKSAKPVSAPIPEPVPEIRPDPTAHLTPVTAQFAILSASLNSERSFSAVTSYPFFEE